MKKYWKLMMLSAFTIIVVCIFYIRAGTVTNSFPTFTFEKVEGNETAVENLVLNGDLFNGMFNHESFRVDNEGTTYLRDEPFNDRFKGYYQDLYIERLQKEHRNFMRGKTEDPNYFYEDEDILAYGNTPYELWTNDHYTFEIAVLDKQTNDIVSFSLPIPNREDYWYVEPQNIYVDGKELSFITLNEKMNNEIIENTSVYLYTIDIEKEQLVHEEELGSLDYSNTGEGYSDINILKDERSLIIVGNIITPVEYDENLGFYEEIATINTLIKYNLNTREVEELSLPKDEELGIPVALNGNQLSFANAKKDELTLSNYNVEKQKVSGELEVDTFNLYMSITDIFQAKIKDDKFYFIPSSNDLEELTTVLVIDITTLTVDYVGKIEHTKPFSNNVMMEVYFNNSEFKNE